MNEKNAAAENENNVLVEQENVISEILECERKNCHALSVREREAFENLKEMRNQVDLIATTNKVMSKEISLWLR